MYVVHNMTHIPDNSIKQALLPYFSPVSPLLCDQVRLYIDLLLRWNRRISLTTVTDPSEILRFHFGESLFAVPSVPIRHGRLADVGSGAGFPAVPIRMAVEGLSVLLIESNQKKAAFLAELTRELHLQNVEVYRGRMESVAVSTNLFDYISARALGDHEKLLRWSNTRLNPEGRVVLWLGAADAAKISNLNEWSWESPTKIPATDRRVILTGSKS
jgi:16S rRNA (guanine527-N7)-methyltransferase